MWTSAQISASAAPTVSVSRPAATVNISTYCSIKMSTIIFDGGRVYTADRAVTGEEKEENPLHVIFYVTSTVTLEEHNHQL